jgi:hypothetical protein
MKKLFPLLLLVLAGLSYGQEDQRHTSSWERFQHLRIIPPATIVVATDGKSLEFKVTEKTNISTGKLDIDSDVRAPQGFGSDPKKLWWIYYCDEHHTGERIGTAVIIESYELPDKPLKAKGAKP